MSGYESGTVFGVIVWSVIGSVCDIEWRKIPNRFVFAFFAATVAAWVFSMVRFDWVAFVTALAIAFLADLQPGDAKGVAILGGLLGVESMAIMFTAALLIGTGAMALYFFSIIASPKSWPYFPFFAVPACAIVVAHWIGG